MPKPTKPIPRIRKQGARKRAEAAHTIHTSTSADTDSNALEILPLSTGDREARRNKLREELRAAKPESKSSAKKRKRLDKYIVCVPLLYTYTLTIGTEGEY